MTAISVQQSKGRSRLGSPTRLGRVCVTTTWATLGQRLRSALAPAEVIIESRLADLMVHTDCDLYVVDAKVPDMDLWPAPLLCGPGPDRPWVFLVESAGDLSHISRFPAKCLVLERRGPAGVLERLSAYLNAQSHPGAGNKLAGAAYLDRLRAFLVRFDNGSAYILPRSELTEADDSPVLRTRLGRGRHYFAVVQQSGHTFEVPWDEVLYHCEPSYPFYKGRTSGAQNEARAERIGERVRAARESRGLTVTELATKAGMHRPNVSRLEHGRHEPSLDTIERVASALDIPVAQLVTVS